MNCFEWQNRSSDYLDGTLMASFKREADEHLDSCPSCTERHKHYRQIVASIGGQPRSTLPVPIRKAPLAFALPSHESGFRRTRWERAPWFLRTGIEGLGIAFVILLVVAMVPRIREFYERAMERRVDAYGVADLALEAPVGSGPADTPLQRGKSADTSAASAANQEEFAAERDESAATSDDEDTEGGSGEGDGEKAIRVGASQIWRFNLKTDSPREVRTQVVKILTELGLPAQTSGLGGVEAPGGIQFDLLVPTSVVAPLKTQLAKLAPSTPSDSDAAVGTEAFTWYKNKSRKPIPSGRARIVIWLSQM